MEVMAGMMMISATFLAHFPDKIVDNMDMFLVGRGREGNGGASGSFHHPKVKI